MNALFPICASIALGVVMIASAPCQASEARALPLEVKALPLQTSQLLSQPKPQAEDAKAQTVQDAIRALLTGDPTQLDERLKHHDALLKYYEGAGFEPLWPKLGRTGVVQLTQNLEASWEHGLNPAHYLIFTGEDDGRDIKDQARRELLLSEAYIRYVRDLTGARINNIERRKTHQLWRKPVAGDEALTDLAKQTSVNEQVGGYIPNNYLYQSLKKELKKSIQDHDYDDFEPIRFSEWHKILRPGEAHPDVQAVRKRLGLSADSRAYDDEMVRAVRTFQKDVGLTPDGMIGEMTKQALARTPLDHVLIILANMERLRAMEPIEADKYVWVNIPAMTLVAIEGKTVAFQMPVVVGRKKRQTPAFRTKIRGVRFNPTWTVPPTVKKKDFLPKLIQDPLYLTERGFELTRTVDGIEEMIDPTSVDWAMLTPGELHQISMIQRPGSDNALGSIRVLMPNIYSIFLHDTHEQGAFDREMRLLSSGCVRLSDPQKMASFILKDNQGFSEEIIPVWLEQNETIDIRSAEPVPIYLVYQTIWLNDKGGLIYGPDIYEEDRAFVTKLIEMNGIYIPGLKDKVPSSILEDSSQITDARLALKE